MPVSVVPPSPSPLVSQICVGLEKPDPQTWACYRPQGTQDWIIQLTLTGRGLYRGDAPLESSPGVLVMAPPRTPHDCVVHPSARRWVHYWAHFLPPKEWQEMLSLPRHASGLMAIDTSRSAAQRPIAAAFERMLRVASSAAPARERLAMCALQEILVWAGTLHDRGVIVRKDPLIDRAAEYLSSNLARPINLQDLAAATGQSVSRISHLFRSQVGMTPMQFLEEQRLERAMQLLARTPMSVKEVSGAVGFATPFYFTNRFRRRTGMSPRQFRATQNRETFRRPPR